VLWCEGDHAGKCHHCAWQCPERFQTTCTHAVRASPHRLHSGRPPQLEAGAGFPPPSQWRRTGRGHRHRHRGIRGRQGPGAAAGTGRWPAAAAGGNAGQRRGAAARWQGRHGDCPDSSSSSDARRRQPRPCCGGRPAPVRGVGWWPGGTGRTRKPGAGGTEQAAAGGASAAGDRLAAPAGALWAACATRSLLGLPPAHASTLLWSSVGLLHCAGRWHPMQARVRQLEARLLQQAAAASREAAAAAQAAAAGDRGLDALLSPEMLAASTPPASFDGAAGASAACGDISGYAQLVAAAGAAAGCSAAQVCVRTRCLCMQVCASAARAGRHTQRSHVHAPFVNHHRCAPC
jgi:hypothetical protein